MALRDLEDIVQRSLSIGLVGPERRRQLLHGLPMGFVYSLPTVSRPVDQLRFDLMELGRTPRLIGLPHPPLAVWLRNAATIAGASSRADALFFERRASALDGQPVSLGVGNVVHVTQTNNLTQDKSTHVTNVDNSTHNTHTDHSTQVSGVRDGSIGVNHGPVTIYNVAPGDAPLPTPPPPGSNKATAPSGGRPTVVIGIGVGAPDAQEVAKGHQMVVSAVHAIDVPAGTWEQPPTDPGWRLVARRVEELVGALKARTVRDIALLAETASPAMLAWTVTRLQRGAIRRRRLHVFDPQPYTEGEEWYLPDMAPDGSEDDRVCVDFGEEPIDASTSGIALRIDLDGSDFPAHRDVQVAGGGPTITIEALDPAPSGAAPLADHLAPALVAALNTVRRKLPRAHWHVFYDGPPSVWCHLVQALLRARQRLTVYANDHLGAEHAAFELPSGEWLDRRDPEGKVRSTYDVFLACPEEADDLALALYAELSSRYRVFYDGKTLLPGDDWFKLRPAAQANALVSLLIITPATAKSWFRLEEVVAAADLGSREDSAYRVIPLLAHGADESHLPRGLSHLKSIIWREHGDAEALFEQLRRAIDATRAQVGAPDSDGSGT